MRHPSRAKLFVVQGLLAPFLAGTPSLAELPPSFPPGAVWTTNVSAASLHPDSATMISTLDGLGGFGLGRMQVDFSIHVVHAEAGAPVRTIVSHPDGYFLPDCEAIGTEIPVPPTAVLEGESGLSCTSDGDCHLLVVQGDTLYEVYRGNEASSTTLEAQCLAIWYLSAQYPPEGRGDHCTSADAAGFPIAPLLFNADEIAASLAFDPTGGGDLGHAIRFILPNDRMASDVSLGGVAGRLYVRPASHAGGPSGPVGSVPYGARLRLKQSFDVAGYEPSAKVVLNTLKRFGMVLADGGSVALTAQSDLHTTSTWSELNFDSQTFFSGPGTAVEITDFDVLDTGDRIAETYECVRTEISPALFVDGFETGDASVWQ